MSAAVIDAAAGCYPTLMAYLTNDADRARPALPPGGCCGAKDNDHMTFLAFTLKKFGREERLRKLHSYAVLLEQIAPGDPCVGRVMQWHEEVLGAAP